MFRQNMFRGNQHLTGPFLIKEMMYAPLSKLFARPRGRPVVAELGVHISSA